MAFLQIPPPLYTLYLPIYRQVPSKPIASAAAGLNLLVHSVVIGHNPHSNSDGYLTNHPASYAGWCGVRPGLKDIRTGQGLWIVVVILGGRVDAVTYRI